MKSTWAKNYDNKWSLLYLRIELLQPDTEELKKTVQKKKKCKKLLRGKNVYKLTFKDVTESTQDVKKIK